jgi:hypothetical protein
VNGRFFEGAPHGKRPEKKVFFVALGKVFNVRIFENKMNLSRRKPYVGRTLKEM